MLARNRDMLRLVQDLALLVSVVHSLRSSPSARALNSAASESVRDDVGDGVLDDHDSPYRGLEAIRLAHPIWYDSIMQLRLTSEAQSRFQNILWKSSSKYSNVTVLGNSNGSTRILQFEPGLIEAKIDCEESCEILPHEVQIAAECKGCPCTFVNPYLSMGGYLRLPVDHVVKRYRENAKPQNILVVGLGGGTVVNAIRAFCEVRMVHIIEVSETVIHANKLFFGLNASVVTSEEALSDNPGSQVFQGDGEHGVQVMAQKFPVTYDTVFIDCMTGGRVPPGCKSESFYSSIRKLLKASAYVYQWTWLNDRDSVQSGIDKQIGSSSLGQGWVIAAKT